MGEWKIKTRLWINGGKIGEDHCTECIHLVFSLAVLASEQLWDVLYEL
jgi:hypothetical protein